MSVGSLVASGPLLLAIPVAAAAGAVTFLSPCVLPLVPGYLSYITGMSGADVADETVVTGADPGAPGGSGDEEPAGALSGQPARIAAAAGQTLTATAVATAATAPARTWRRPSRGRPRRGRASRSRAVIGALLFVLGFSALFAVEGMAIGGIGSAVTQAGNSGVATRVLGVVVILLGLLFAGAFDRFSFAGRIVKPSVRPRAGLASAPLLGVLFGIGWTPCIGPTLAAVMTLGFSTATAARGGLLAFVYGLGIGIPFLIVAFAVERGVTLFSFARRHAKLITRIGGLLLVVVGLLEVTGAWSSAMVWLKFHWLSNYNPPL